MFRKILALLVLITGVAVFIYPYTFREINEMKYSNESKDYKQHISKLTEEELEQIVRETNEYNKKLSGESQPGNSGDPLSGGQSQTQAVTETVTTTETQVPESDPNAEDNLIRQLSFMQKDDIFAYISLPTIEETIPIYLGATEKHLEMGAAHVKGTSLPVGGENTHSVISAHRGWAKATLFRHIDKLKPGDIFYIYVYGNRLAYKVSGREIILPDDISKLEIVPGEDRVTLLTCHPYPYMTHRLLVHAFRTKDDGREVKQGFKSNIMTKVTGTNINNAIEYSEGLTQSKVDSIWEENRMIFTETVPVTAEKFEVIPENITIVNLGDKYDIDVVKKVNLGIVIAGVIIIIICVILLIKEIIVFVKRMAKR